MENNIERAVYVYILLGLVVGRHTINLNPGDLPIFDEKLFQYVRTMSAVLRKR